MAINSALKAQVPTGLAILADAITKGMLIVEAGRVDVRDWAMNLSAEPILSREDIPALDKALAPLQTGEDAFVAQHRKLVNSLRAVALLGGDDMAVISDWATNHIDEGKVGEVKARKGSAGSLATAIERAMIGGASFEDARRTATSGKHADDGAHKVALGKVESLLEQIGKLRMALSLGFDDEKLAAFDGWVLDGGAFKS